MGDFVTLLQHALASVGFFVVLYILQRTLDFVLFHSTCSNDPLRAYKLPDSKPTYALITGGNGGIGYGIALSLVRHGFGVILLGRDGIRLAAAAERLRDARKTTETASATVSTETYEYVRIIVLNPQTATPQEIETRVGGMIEEYGLQISILVNNVGSAPITYPPYRELGTYSPEDIDNMINLNARFMAHLTRQMLPVLASVHEDKNTGTDWQRRSLILNLGSGAQIGLPYQALYAATKAFNSCLTIGLHRELAIDPKTRHVDVLTVLAGDVRSQGNVAGLMGGSPDSETYGRYIVERTDSAVKRGLKEMTPYWMHHLRFILLSVTPEWLVDKGTIDIMSKKRSAMNEATKPKEAGSHN